MQCRCCNRDSVGVRASYVQAAWQCDLVVRVRLLSPLSVGRIIHPDLLTPETEALAQPRYKDSQGKIHYTGCDAFG